MRRQSEPASEARNAVQQNWNHMFPYESHVSLCISPFQPDGPNTEESDETWLRHDTYCPTMGSATMVPSTANNGSEKPNPSSTGF